MLAHLILTNQKDRGLWERDSHAANMLSLCYFFQISCPIRLLEVTRAISFRDFIIGPYPDLIRLIEYKENHIKKNST